MPKVKILCALLTSLCLVPICYSSGFYVGAGVGPDTAVISHRAHVMQTGNFNAYDTSDLGMSGTFVTLFGGYGYHYGNAYLAGELNVNASDMRYKASNNEILHQSYSQTIYKMPGNMGISVIPGYQLSTILLAYGRLGFSRGHFINDTSDVSLAHFNKWINGFRYGLGLQAKLTSQFDARLEWSHISYQSRSMYTLDTLSSTTKYTKLTPIANQYEFSVIYHI